MRSWQIQLALLVLFLCFLGTDTKKGGHTIGRGGSMSRNILKNAASGYSPPSVRAPAGPGKSPSLTVVNIGGRHTIVRDDSEEADSKASSNSTADETDEEEEVEEDEGLFILREINATEFGFVDNETGKIILENSSAAFLWQNRSYYFDESSYQGPLDGMCHQSLNISRAFDVLYFEDGETQPEEVYWWCEKDEQCCGFGCCQEQAFWETTIGMLTLVGIGILCTALLAAIFWFCCCRRCRDGYSSVRSSPQ